jgi:hypothetical protein
MDNKRTLPSPSDAPQRRDLSATRTMLRALLNEYRDPRNDIHPAGANAAQPSRTITWIDRAAIVLSDLEPIVDATCSSPKTRPEP